MKVIDKEADYSNILASNALVLIQFGAAWCSPCHALTRVLEDMEDGHKDKALFIKIDVDACPNIAESLGIKSLPTLVLIKNQELIEFIVGMQSKSKIESILNRNI
jgi:thioredoxin 1